MTQAGPISPFSGNLEFELREHTVAFSLFFGEWACTSGEKKKKGSWSKERMNQRIKRVREKTGGAGSSWGQLCSCLRRSYL